MWAAVSPTGEPDFFRGAHRKGGRNPAGPFNVGCRQPDGGAGFFPRRPSQRGQKSGRTFENGLPAAAGSYAREPRSGADRMDELSLDRATRAVHGTQGREKRRLRIRLRGGRSSKVWMGAGRTEPPGFPTAPGGLSAVQAPPAGADAPAPGCCARRRFKLPPPGPAA